MFTDARSLGKVFNEMKDSEDGDTGMADCDRYYDEGYAERVSAFKQHVAEAVAARRGATEGGGMSAAAASASEGGEQRKLPREVTDVALEGDTATVIAWLEIGGHIDTTYDEPDGSHAGVTLLMCATIAGRAQLVEALVERGAAIDLQDGDGFTALMYAACEGHAAIVRLLLKAGATRRCAVAMEKRRDRWPTMAATKVPNA